MENKSVMMLRLKGFAYDILGLVDASCLEERDTRTDVQHPVFLKVNKYDPKNGAANVDYIPVISPFADPKAKSLPIWTDEIVYYYPVNDSMATEFRAMVAGIATPSSPIIAARG